MIWKLKKQIWIIFGIFIILALSQNVSALTYIDSCKTLNIENETYILNASIESSGSCLLIYADNITLDCNDFYVKGLQSVVYSNLQINSSTIKNCKINTTRNEGILFYYGASNLFILNTNMSGGNYGIRIISPPTSVNITMRDVIITNVTTQGIQAGGNVTNFTLENFIINATSGTGIYGTDYGFLITISDGSIYGYTGIDIGNSKNVTVKNVNMSILYRGINGVNNGTNISDCNIFGFNESGIGTNTGMSNSVLYNLNLTGRGRGTGINIDNGINRIIENIIINNVTTGISHTGGLTSFNNINITTFGQCLFFQSNNTILTNLICNQSLTTSNNGMTINVGNNNTIDSAIFIGNFSNGNRAISFGVNATIITLKNLDIKGYRYGIYISSNNDNIIIDSVSLLNMSTNGIYLICSSPTFCDNISLDNVSILNSGGSGISTRGTNNLTIDNSVFYNSTTAIDSQDGNYTTISNSEFYNSTSTGISFITFYHLNLVNVSVHDNYRKVSDFYPRILVDTSIGITDIAQCSQTHIENVTQTDGIELIFLNETTLLENISDFEVISLCNADNSRLNNITSIKNGNRIASYFSDNLILNNSQFYNGYGNGFTDSNNISIENIYVNNSAGSFVFSRTNGSLNNIGIDYSAGFLNCQSSNCIINNSYAHFNINDNVSSQYGINIGTNSTAFVKNLTMEDMAYYAIYIRPTSLGFAGLIATDLIIINSPNAIYSDSRYGNTTANIYNAVLDSNVSSLCSSMATNNCSKSGILNLYNTTTDTYFIGINSTMNVFWNVDFINPLSAQVDVYNATSDLIDSFSNSRSLWLMQDYVYNGNIQVNATPHTINATLVGYSPNSTILDVSTNKIFNVILSSPPSPPIIDPDSITGKLVLTIGFGIMGLFAVLTLLGFGAVTTTGRPDPNTIAKIMIAIIIVILLIVSVWQGIVLPP